MLINIKFYISSDKRENWFYNDMIDMILYRGKKIQTVKRVPTLDQVPS